MLFALVQQLRTALPGIAQHILAVDSANGMTVRISGPGMEPEYVSGQLVTYLPLSSDRPKLCDVIVYRPQSSPNQMYVARVVAMPGDTLTMGIYTPATGILVNGKIPCKSNVHGNTGPQSSDHPAQAILTSKQYFVVGDNFSNSEDSRTFGPILRADIVGYVPA